MNASITTELSSIPVTALSVRATPPCQDLDPVRGQMSGVFKLANELSVHWVPEFHYQMGLPTINSNREFSDSARHGATVWMYKFSLQLLTLEPDAPLAI